MPSGADASRGDGWVGRGAFARHRTDDEKTTTNTPPTHVDDIRIFFVLVLCVCSGGTSLCAGTRDIMLKAQGGFWESGRPPSHTDDSAIVFHPHLSVSARRTSGFKHQRASSLGGGSGGGAAGAGDDSSRDGAAVERRYAGIAPLKLALGTGGPPALSRARQTDNVDV